MEWLYAGLFALGDVLMVAGFYLLLAIYGRLRKLEHRIEIMTHPSRTGRVVPMQPMPRHTEPLLKGQTAADALAAARLAQAYVKRRYGQRMGRP